MTPVRMGGHGGATLARPVPDIAEIVRLADPVQLLATRVELDITVQFHRDDAEQEVVHSH